MSLQLLHQRERRQNGHRSDREPRLNGKRANGAHLAAKTINLTLWICKECNYSNDHGNEQCVACGAFMTRAQANRFNGAGGGAGGADNNRRGRRYQKSRRQNGAGMNGHGHGHLEDAPSSKSKSKSRSRSKSSRRNNNGTTVSSSKKISTPRTPMTRKGKEVAATEARKEYGGGIPFDFFADPRKVKDLVCPFCQLIARDALQLHCKNRHGPSLRASHHPEDRVYCQRCLTGFLAKNADQCPINGHDFCEYGPDEDARHRIEKRRAICPNSGHFQTIYPCTWEGRIKGIDDHLATCNPIRGAINMIKEVETDASGRLDRIRSDCQAFAKSVSSYFIDVRKESKASHKECMESISSQKSELRRLRKQLDISNRQIHQLRGENDQIRTLLAKFENTLNRVVIGHHRLSSRFDHANNNPGGRSPFTGAIQVSPPSPPFNRRDQISPTPETVNEDDEDDDDDEDVEENGDERDHKEADADSRDGGTDDEEDRKMSPDDDTNANNPGQNPSSFGNGRGLPPPPSTSNLFSGGGLPPPPSNLSLISESIGVEPIPHGPGSPPSLLSGNPLPSKNPGHRYAISSSASELQIVPGLNPRGGSNHAGTDSLGSAMGLNRRRWKVAEASLALSPSFEQRQALESERNSGVTFNSKVRILEQVSRTPSLANTQSGPGPSQTHIRVVSGRRFNTRMARRKPSNEATFLNVQRQVNIQSSESRLLSSTPTLPDRSSDEQITESANDCQQEDDNNNRSKGRPILQSSQQPMKPPPIKTHMRPYTAKQKQIHSAPSNPRTKKQKKSKKKGPIRSKMGRVGPVIKAITRSRSRSRNKDSRSNTASRSRTASRSVSPGHSKEKHRGRSKKRGRLGKNRMDQSESRSRSLTPMSGGGRRSREKTPHANTADESDDEIDLDGHEDEMESDDDDDDDLPYGDFDEDGVHFASQSGNGWASAVAGGAHSKSNGGATSSHQKASLSRHFGGPSGDQNFAQTPTTALSKRLSRQFSQRLGNTVNRLIKGQQGKTVVAVKRARSGGPSHKAQLSVSSKTRSFRDRRSATNTPTPGTTSVGTNGNPYALADRTNSLPRPSSANKVSAVKSKKTMGPSDSLRLSYLFKFDQSSSRSINLSFRGTRIQSPSRQSRQMNDGPRIVSCSKYPMSFEMGGIHTWQVKCISPGDYKNSQARFDVGICPAYHFKSNIRRLVHAPGSIAWSEMTTNLDPRALRGKKRKKTKNAGKGRLKRKGSARRGMMASGGVSGFLKFAEQMTWNEGEVVRVSVNMDKGILSIWKRDEPVLCLYIAEVSSASDEILQKRLFYPVIGVYSWRAQLELIPI